MNLAVAQIPGDALTLKSSMYAANPGTDSFTVTLAATGEVTINGTSAGTPEIYPNP